MRILIHSVPPWAPSGYGHQCRLTAHALTRLGHEVAVSAYAGVHEERDYQGVPILGTGAESYGNGVIALNYRRWRADLLLLFTDLFVIEPGQMAGLNVMPWVPVDCDPLGVKEKNWLDVARKIAKVYPVAMSAHGQKMLAAEGWHVPVVPHATEMQPDQLAGARWRLEVGLSPQHFVIGKVAWNDMDDRKAYGVTLQAFAAFAAKHKEAVLYVHALAQQPPKAPNLAMMGVRLGLQNRMIFCDQDRRAADLFDQQWMQGVYSGLDVLDGATKGEGFGCPPIDALACGTPVIAARNSAMPEKIEPAYGWLIGGQREWSHHNAWWMTPSVPELRRAYTAARGQARQMRPAAERAGRTWSADAMTAAWAKALAGI